MPIYLERLTWKDFQRLVPRTHRVAIIPIGTIEAHGVCAIGTDNLIPADLAAQIADDLKAIVCPPISYGLVRGLAGYPGSVPVSDDAFTAYVTEVLAELGRRGFERIIVLNGHGGNTAALKNAAYAAHDKTRKKIVVIDWWFLADDVCREVYAQEGAHAGCDENGYILALDPELVKARDFSDDLLFLTSPAVAAFPYPGPVVMYKAGEGAPDFDRDKAVRYRRGAIEKVREYLVLVMDRWDKIDAPV